MHYGFIPLPDGSNWGEIARLVYENAYPVVGEENKRMIWRAGIDIGGGKYADSIDTQTERVYDFLRQYGGEKIKATKGASGSYLLHKIKITTLDNSTSKAASKAASRGIEILTLDTAAFKDAIWYRINQTNAGRLTFHKDCREDIFRHILAEEKRKDRRGKTEWVRIARDNHLLDCMVIAFAMADSEYLGGVKMIATLRETNNNIVLKKSPWRI
ncbi:MAG: phage terminase large subunit family protein [Deltaproteobacteria bacterium]|nr:phage terminase large subunit family protein [Deltaproteobacteria bacterium]